MEQWPTLMLVGSVVALVMVGAKLIIDRKDAHIAYLKGRISELENEAPDALLEQVQKRLKATNEELERSEDDNTALRGEVARLDAEVGQLRAELERLRAPIREITLKAEGILFNVTGDDAALFRAGMSHMLTFGRRDSATPTPTGRRVVDLPREGK